MDPTEAKNLTPSVGLQPQVLPRAEGGGYPDPPTPTDVRPILAVIQKVGDLGPQMWREVVHYDTDAGEWRPFAGSDTFRDGERVTRWIYADEALP